MIMNLLDAKLCIIGLGYVGLPLAVEFGKSLPTIGFDISQHRISSLIDGIDHTLEVSSIELSESSRLSFTSNPDRLKEANVFIVTVPTPIDSHRRPDLGPLLAASALVGEVISPGSVVIFESTVYPGATQDDCVPVIEGNSGLKCDLDFFVGYSPERINPGDKKHGVTTITKVTSGSTPEAADFIDSLYSSIVIAGTFKASSIRVAEAAKVIENTQRDLNIALVNELAIIFNSLGIDTVLQNSVVTIAFFPAPLVDNDTSYVNPSIFVLTSPSNNVKWYADTLGSAVLYSGANFTTPLLTQNTTYYVREFGGTAVYGGPVT